MGSVIARYRALCAAGEIAFDPAQAEMAERLSELEKALETYQPVSKRSALGWIFSRREQSPPKGIYLWGEVGRGKTMLMDLFMQTAPVLRRRRAHFHEFMNDVHERIHDFRQGLKAGTIKGDDPIAPVADQLADEAWLLCFDEFTVTDIADAMILGRLFQRLFERGVVIVATSNVPPDELYKNGLNRSLFLPFIDLIKQKSAIEQLAARTDFRLEKLNGRPVWFSPLGPEADQGLDALWRAVTGGAEVRPASLRVKGRHVRVPKAAHGIARFAFADLCEQPLGGADFLAIAHAYHTVFIENIPVLPHDRRNEAKRLIILIDALYDNRVKLVASADAQPMGLYLGEDGREAFEFARTASRLIEMRSDDYLGLPHGRGNGAAGASATGIVET